MTQSLTPEIRRLADVYSCLDQEWRMMHREGPDAEAMRAHADAALVKVIDECRASDPVRSLSSSGETPKTVACLPARLLTEQEHNDAEDLYRKLVAEEDPYALARVIEAFGRRSQSPVPSSVSEEVEQALQFVDDNAIAYRNEDGKKLQEAINTLRKCRRVLSGSTTEKSPEVEHITARDEKRVEWLWRRFAQADAEVSVAILGDSQWTDFRKAVDDAMERA